MPVLASWSLYNYLGHFRNVLNVSVCLCISNDGVRGKHGRSTLGIPGGASAAVFVHFAVSAREAVYGSNSGFSSHINTLTEMEIYSDGDGKRVQTLPLSLS